MSLFSPFSVHWQQLLSLLFLLCGLLRTCLPLVWFCFSVCCWRSLCLTWLCPLWCSQEPSGFPSRSWLWKRRAARETYLFSPDLVTYTLPVGVSRCSPGANMGSHVAHRKVIEEGCVHGVNLNITKNWQVPTLCFCWNIFKYKCRIMHWLVPSVLCYVPSQTRFIHPDTTLWLLINVTAFTLCHWAQ